MSHKYWILIFLIFFLITSCGKVATPTNIERMVTATSTAHVFTATAYTPKSDEISNQDSLFTANDLNEIPPVDIIQEIVFYGGLGGCGRFCACELEDSSKPTLHAEEDPIEVFQSIGFQICGTGAEGIVHVNVDLPDGSQSQFEGIGTEGIEYVPSLRAPKGQYHLVFSGNGWELEKTITVTDADGPRLYLTKDSEIIFYKFSPNEEVRLVAYEGGKLIGWKTYRVDSLGDLSVKTDLDAVFIAVGEVSGQVFHRDEGEWINWTAWLGGLPDIYCGGSQLSSGIVPDGYARVLVDSLQAYKLNPDNSWAKTGDIHFAKDSFVRIASNAKCLDGQFAWSVECIDRSCSGWIPEAGAEGAFLEPIQQLPPNSTPDPASIPACPETLSSRLQVGMNAEVTTSGMAPQLSLRAQPSMSAEKVHVIAAGRDMVILQGPVCADNSYWWYIRSEQGFEGWAREGDNEDYWIDPLK